MTLYGGKLSDNHFNEMIQKFNTYLNTNIYKKEDLSVKDLLLKLHSDKLRQGLLSVITEYKDKDSDVSPTNEIDTLINCIARIIEKNKSTFEDKAANKNISYIRYNLDINDITNIRRDIETCINDLRSEREPIKQNRGYSQQQQQNRGYYNEQNRGYYYEKGRRDYRQERDSYERQRRQYESSYRKYKNDENCFENEIDKLKDFILSDKKKEIIINFDKFNEMLNSLNKFTKYNLSYNNYLKNIIQLKKFNINVQPLYRLKLNKIKKKYDYVYINQNLYELLLTKNINAKYYGSFIIHYYNDFIMSLNNYNFIKLLEDIKASDFPYIAHYFDYKVSKICNKLNILWNFFIYWYIVDIIRFYKDGEVYKDGLMNTLLNINKYYKKREYKESAKPNGPSAKPNGPSAKPTARPNTTRTARPNESTPRANTTRTARPNESTARPNEFTATPNAKPTARPNESTARPNEFTATPNAKPTARPNEFTATPNAKPTATPSAKPTATPSAKPTATPTKTEDTQRTQLPNNRKLTPISETYTPISETYSPSETYSSDFNSPVSEKSNKD